MVYPLRVNTDVRDTFAFRADYVAEMARAAVFEQYGEPAYVSGIKVYTTVTRKDQEEANAALRFGVMEYDRRHGYRAPEARADLPEQPGAELDDAVEEALQDRDLVADLVPAVVLEASAKATSSRSRATASSSRRARWYPATRIAPSAAAP